ncbi:Mur ligase [Cladochytrium replicatum]|nr:Mur ligase [Cladochytrium replicatum]
MSINLGLQRITALLRAVDSPQTRFKVIHVAGTNGKGSIVALTTSILRSSPSISNVGTYTSPHLHHPRDAIRINGNPMTLSQYESTRSYALAASEAFTGGTPPSPFELNTCIAFMHFAEHRVDVAVVEVGLGGRLDATNVFPPKNVLAAVVGCIGLDHVEFLGDSVEAIAREKAGIVKVGVEDVVVAPQRYTEATRTVEEFVEGLNASGEKPAPQGGATPVKKIRFRMPLHGDFQLENVGTALNTIAVVAPKLLGFKLTMRQLVSGIERTRWPGRLEWVHVPNSTHSVLVDGAHNADAAIELRRFVDLHVSRTPGAKNACWILGFSSRKKVEGILELLLKPGDIVFSAPFESPVDMPWVKCVQPDEIRDAVLKHHEDVRARAFDNVGAAVDAAEMAGRDVTVVAGSLYLVAQLYRSIGKE